MEKTFEELIDQFSYRGNYVNSEKVVGEESVLELMQQVREATIAECAEIAHEHWLSPSFSPKHSINRLPTDRIRIEP